jgi:hypothetical protein
MENVAVIKLGARIASGGTSGGSGEALSIISILSNVFEVHYYTKILDKDKLIDGAVPHQIAEEYELVNSSFDKLFVINGNVNFFGGVEDHEQLLNYKIINNFEGGIYYLMCDPNLSLKQVWPSVSKKEWSSNWSKKDLEITRDDIKYICQARDLKMVYNKIISKTKITIKKENIVHFPFEKFPLYTLEEIPKSENPEWDILYGGTFRGGKREEDMIKFFFGIDDNISIEMFGKIKPSQFKKNTNKLSEPKFGSSVKYQDFNKKMNKGLATVIIGDKIYKQLDNMAQRAYESIMCNNIVFIDSSYDKNFKVFSNENLQKFNYISNRKDLEKRIYLLKNKSGLREKILTMQKKDVMIESFNEYSNRFKDLL